MALTKITSRILDSSGVTTVGTISTGVWQGTAINQTYLVGQSGTNTGDETLARINALNVTELGTISSGVWNGTAINQTYLVGQSGTNTGDETLARINALDVTELGTISSGVWNGTAIASAYLDADTAHLSTTQTFTGAKTFSSGGIFSSSSQGKLKLVAGSNEYLSLEFANASGTTQWEISKNNTHDLYFYKGGYRMMLKADGKVGIGTTSPSQQLHIYSGAGGGSAPDSRTKLLIEDDGEAYLGFNVPATSFTGIRLQFAGTTKAIFECWDQAAQTPQVRIGSVDSRPVSLQTDNTPRLTVLGTSGNVGIGTTSPDYQLDIENSSHAVLRIHAGTNSSASLRLKNDAIDWDVNCQTNDTFAVYNHTSNTQPFSILPNGNVGIGTTSSSTTLDVVSNTSSQYAARIINASTQSSTTAPSINFAYSNGSTSYGMVMNKGSINSGYFIGCFNPSNTLSFQVLGNGDVQRCGMTQGTNHFISLSGDLPGHTANQYNCLKTDLNDLHFAAGGVYTGYISYNSGFTDVSDASLKENVEDIPDALSKVKNLRGRYYTWINELQDNERQVGFIAQEVEQQVPEVISEGAGGTKGVAYGKLTAVLVNAIKEQQTIIEDLKSRIQTLEG